MRGNIDHQQPTLIAFNIEERMPEDHPLRPIKQWCDRVLAKMSRDFNKAYGKTGRVGIPPECLIKALLLRALFSIPSEIRLCEACEYNLLYRWLSTGRWKSRWSWAGMTGRCCSTCFTKRRAPRVR